MEGLQAVHSRGYVAALRPVRFCGGNHATNYLDMLQEFILSQLTQDGVLDTLIFQDDDAPPRGALIVREF
jgi:hypothetical protein